MSKLFARKPVKTKSEADLLQLRIMRQQIEANETNRLLGMITDNEYREVMSRLTKQVEELEAKYDEQTKSD